MDKEEDIAGVFHHGNLATFYRALAAMPVPVPVRDLGNGKRGCPGRVRATMIKNMRPILAFMATTGQWPKAKDSIQRVLS